MIVYCDGGQYFIYTLIQNASELTPSTRFSVFYLFEYIFLLLSVIFGLFFVHIILKIKIWHQNLSILAIFFIFAALTRSLGRFLISSQEFNAFSSGYCYFYLHAGSCCIIFATCFSVHIFPTVLVERSFSYFYLADYELKSRAKIPFLLSFFNCFVSLFLTYLLYTAIIDQICVTLYSGVIISLSVMGYLCLWKINKNAYKAYGLSMKPESYSLSRRFQLIENIRVFNLAKDMTICLVIDAAIVFSSRIGASFISETGAGKTVFIQSMMSLLHLVVILTCMICCEKWRNHLLSILTFNTLKGRNKSRVNVSPSEQEIYFQQLNTAWA